MKNWEKYKTAEERTKAMESMCKSGDDQCKRCPLYQESADCQFLWLDLEAEEEKPMPCPFCNNEYVEVGKGAAGMREVRCICGYRSQAKESEHKAIAAHNRVCKAVAAMKENEKGGVE